MESQATYGSHIVNVYLEDSDFTGVVYHSNYVNYFERAREHLLNPTLLVELWDNEGVGFTVTKVELNYKQGARYGDVLEIRTTPILSSKYRISFDQQVWKQGSDKALVLGMVEMVCLSKEGKLVEIPHQIQHDLNKRYGMKI